MSPRHLFPRPNFFILGWESEFKRPKAAFIPAGCSISHCCVCALPPALSQPNFSPVWISPAPKGQQGMKKPGTGAQQPSSGTSADTQRPHIPFRSLHLSSRFPPWQTQGATSDKFFPVFWVNLCELQAQCARHSPVCLFSPSNALSTHHLH